MEQIETFILDIETKAEKLVENTKEECEFWRVGFHVFILENLGCRILLLFLIKT
ncbi:MAG: hypothetical protein ACTSQL_04765 [Promethearchaeota archaeon]